MDRRRAPPSSRAGCKLGVDPDELREEGQGPDEGQAKRQSCWWRSCHFRIVEEGLRAVDLGKFLRENRRN